MDKLLAKSKGYVDKVNTHEPIESDDSVQTDETKINHGEQEQIDNEQQEIIQENNSHKEQIQMYYESLDHSTLENISKREYKYHSDFDKNGILYAIGVNFDCNTKTKWENPVTNGKIVMTSYPKKLNSGLLSDMVGRSGTNCELNSQNVQNASFTIDFVGLKICATHYTLRHGYHYKYGCL
eukprot:471327_1